MFTRAISVIPLSVVLVLGLQVAPRGQDGQAGAPATVESVDADVMWKIRREATDRSQIMRTLHVLTDVYGPRLTGSPNLRQAQDWLLEQATLAGLKNAHLEEWDFGNPGWLNEKTAVHVVAPVKDSLVAEALAWTPGTRGTITASTVLVTPPARPTQKEADTFFDRLRGSLKGRAVMVGPPATLSVTIAPPAKRRDDNDLHAQFSGNAPPASGPPAPAPPPAIADGPAPLTADQFAEQFNVFLVRAGAVLRINDAGREHGQIRAFNNRSFDVTKAVPTVVMRNEDYGRIARLMASGRVVDIEATIVNQSYAEGRTQHNVVAEIPGSDKAEEVVMLGGHLDSWHAATGATDNAIGVATMYEAIRILQAIGVTPRRTIRLALWSGEEQGLRGSAGLRGAALRHLRESQAGVRELRRLLQHRLGHRPGARHDGVRSAGGRRRPAAGAGAVCEHRRGGRQHHAVSTFAAARITRRSTRSACRASAWRRIRSSTARTPGTPTSTPTSASSRATRRSRPWSSPAPCITWPCATRSCRASPRTRCRRGQRRRDSRTSVAGVPMEWAASRASGGRTRARPRRAAQVATPPAACS